MEVLLSKEISLVVCKNKVEYNRLHNQEIDLVQRVKIKERKTIYQKKKTVKYFMEHFSVKKQILYYLKQKECNRLYNKENKPGSV